MAMDDDRAKALEAGMDECIAKPVEVGALEDVLARVLSKQQNRAAELPGNSVGFVARRLLPPVRALAANMLAYVPDGGEVAAAPRFPGVPLHASIVEFVGAVPDRLNAPILAEADDFGRVESLLDLLACGRAALQVLWLTGNSRSRYCQCNRRGQGNRGSHDGQGSGESPEETGNSRHGGLLMGPGYIRGVRAHGYAVQYGIPTVLSKKDRKRSLREGAAKSVFRIIFPEQVFSLVFFCKGVISAVAEPY